MTDQSSPLRAASSALCPSCAGTGATAGAFFLHDFIACEHCNGSGLAADGDLPPSPEEFQNILTEFSDELVQRVRHDPTVARAMPLDPEHLRTELRRLIDLGDPLAVALLCALAWRRGWLTTSCPPASAEGWAISAPPFSA